MAIAPAAVSTDSELTAPTSTDRARADISVPSWAQGASARAAPNPAATKAIMKEASSACGIDAAASCDLLVTASPPASAAYGTATASAAPSTSRRRVTR